MRVQWSSCGVRSFGSCHRGNLHRLARMILALVLGLARLGVAGEPFTPASDQTVLVRLSVPGLSSGLRTAATASAQAIDPATAARDATEWVRRARLQSDASLLSRAEAALGPWWKADAANFEVFFVRAEIHQGLHRFDAAMRDLEAALRLEPRHAGAWLLKASIHQVRGEYPAARQATLQLARSASPLIATTAAASLAGLGEQASDAALHLADALSASSGESSEVLAWAWTNLGEIRARLGRTAEAEQSFREALRWEPESTYARAALADLLLDAGRALEALEVIGDRSAEALEVRRAEAEMQGRPDRPATRERIERLEALFRQAANRGPELHAREHARLQLHVLRNPAAALKLAQTNFTVQKEPEDVRLLIEAARAAGDSAVERDTRRWAERHQPAVVRQLPVRR